MKRTLTYVPSSPQTEDIEHGDEAADVPSSDKTGLTERDLAQILAYAAQSMTTGPNIELGTVGIIVENNPNGVHFPSDPP